MVGKRGWGAYARVASRAARYAWSSPAVRQYALRTMRAGARAVGRKVLTYAGVKRKRAADAPAKTIRKAKRVGAVRRVGRPFRGEYRGRFKKPWRGSQSAVNWKGVQMVRESGGVIGDANSVYCAATCFPVRITAECVHTAVIKQAMLFFGFKVNNIEQPYSLTATDNFFFQFEYINAAGGAVTVSTSGVFSGNTSVLAVAQAHMDQLMGLMSGNRVYFELTKMGFFYQRPGTGETVDKLYIMAKDIKLYLAGSLNFHVQNRTSAVAATHPTNVDDEYNAFNVANNPLVGRVYTGSGLQVRVRSQESVVSNPFIELVRDSGTDAIGYASTTDTTLRKPPPSYSLNGVYKDTKVRLGPGKIKNLTSGKVKNMNFDGWLRFFGPWYREAASAAAATGGVRIAVPIIMFGLEKMLDCRSNEPDIEVGYQAEASVGVIATFNSRSYTTPRYSL